MSTPAKMRAALDAFRALEWERSDWQGFCPFRRNQFIRCQGTDGHVSAVGRPKPKPHSDGCPYALLAGLNLEKKP